MALLGAEQLLLHGSPQGFNILSVRDSRCTTWRAVASSVTFRDARQRTPVSRIAVYRRVSVSLYSGLEQLPVPRVHKSGCSSNRLRRCCQTGCVAQHSDGSALANEAEPLRSARTPTAQASSGQDRPDEPAPLMSLSNPRVSRVEGNWTWKEVGDLSVPIHYVAYIPSDSASSTEVSTPAVLFLHGFGVGTFQFETCCRLLAEKGYSAWCIDFLGQGASFPDCDEAWHGLDCSIESWYQMTADFIQDKIGRKVHLVGNSVGGYVALLVAAKSPALCAGLMLLNATPFWGFNVTNWDGVFPAPGWINWIGGRALRVLGNRQSVSSILDMVYVKKNLASENSGFVEDILKPVQNPLAPAAFASIFASPRSSQSYSELIDSLPESMGVCLAYGKQDPWVVPLWGQRFKRQRPSTVYYEVDSAGHCPHHEEPEKIIELLAEWASHLDEGSGPESFALEGYGFWQKDGLPGSNNIFEQVDYGLWQRLRGKQ